jgi:hypothetical protein
MSDRYRVAVFAKEMTGGPQEEKFNDIGSVEKPMPQYEGLPPEMLEELASMRTVYVDDRINVAQADAWNHRISIERDREKDARVAAMREVILNDQAHEDRLTGGGAVTGAAAYQEAQRQDAEHEARLTAIKPKKEVPATTAEQITAAFEATRGAYHEGLVQKVGEYDARIRAIRAGQAMVPGDTEEQLRKDFYTFTKANWSEDFELQQFAENRAAEIRAGKVQPVEFGQIAENPNTERRKYSGNEISFVQRGDEVVALFQGKEWYVMPGTYLEKTVDGKQVKIVMTSGLSAEHASYVPSGDYYTIGPKAKEEFLRDPESFLASLNHESAHREYFAMDERSQRELNDTLLNDPALAELVKKFARTLYDDKFMVGNHAAGEAYLETHDPKNKSTAENVLSQDGSLGLKDARTVSFEIDGKRRDVLVGLLLTEFISYMSSSEMGDATHHKVAGQGRAIRNGEDPRYDVVHAAWKVIQRDPKLAERFGKSGLYKNSNQRFQEAFTESM